MKTWPHLNPGELVHQVRLQHRQETTDISGTATVWVDYLAAMAAVEPMRGLDVIKSGQEITQLPVTVTMYWAAGVLPSMRVVTDSGETLAIRAIENPDGRNLVLKLHCVALGDQP